MWAPILGHPTNRLDAIARCLVIAVATAPACGRIGFGTVAPDDARTDAVDSASSPDARVQFGTATFVSSLVVAGMNTSNPTPSDDELTIMFILRVDLTQQGDIYVATRPSTSADWGAPVAVNELNSSDDESGLHLSRDGLTAWFGSLRPGGLGNHDIWTAQRATLGSPFAAPTDVTEVNTSADETNAGVDGTETIMVLSEGSAPEQLEISQRPDLLSMWNAPVVLPELDGPDDNLGATLSPDALTIYFASSRPGDAGGLDLWVAKPADRHEPVLHARAAQRARYPVDRHHAVDLIGRERHLLHLRSYRRRGDLSGEPLSMSVIA